MQPRSLHSRLVIGWSLGLFSCGDSDPEREITAADASARRSDSGAALEVMGRLGPEGGRLEIEDVQLEVPPGALDEGVVIRIRVVPEPVPLPDDVEVSGDFYEVTPHGLSFSVPINISLPYDGPTDATLGLLRLEDADDDSWEPVTEDRFDGGRAYFETGRLSYYTVVRSCPLFEDSLEPGEVVRACGARECGPHPEFAVCGSCGSCGSGESCDAEGTCQASSEPADAGTATDARMAMDASATMDASTTMNTTMDAGTDADSEAGSSIDAGTDADLGGDDDAGAEVATDCASDAADCVSCNDIKAANPSAADGPYLIDPDGADTGEPPFMVYCNMTVNGGGWTLVDNDAVTAEVYASREPGANADINVTRGSVLPGYAWSSDPQVLCISDHYDGTEGWVTLRALNAEAQSYPTSTTGADFADSWEPVILNGNTDRGTESFTFVTTYDNFGSLWVGDPFTPTCACNYSIVGYTGLGAVDITGDMTTCSTWVR